jgi:chromosome segregation ATPase
VEVANIRIEAERERQAVIDRHRAREERLEFETENLLRQLEAEKTNMEANKELIKQTLIEKNKLDSELAQIKEQFNTEAAMHLIEQEARRSEIENLQESAQLQADQAEQRIADLQTQLATREQEKEEAILAIQQEMK